MNEGVRIALAMRNASRALQESARQTKRRKREIAENDDITTDERKIQHRRLREEGLARHKKLVAEIEKLQGLADRWAKHVHVTRPGDDSKHADVRRMLDQQVTPAAILERAVEIGDTETVAALGAAMLWFGNKDGFADTRATIAACDRALAQIAPGEEQNVNQGLVSMSEASEPLTAVVE